MSDQLPHQQQQFPSHQTQQQGQTAQQVNPHNPNFTHYRGGPPSTGSSVTPTTPAGGGIPFGAPTAPPHYALPPNYQGPVIMTHQASLWEEGLGRHVLRTQTRTYPNVSLAPTLMPVGSYATVVPLPSPAQLSAQIPQAAVQPQQLSDWSQTTQNVEPTHTPSTQTQTPSGLMPGSSAFQYSSEEYQDWGEDEGMEYFQPTLSPAGSYQNLGPTQQFAQPQASQPQQFGQTQTFQAPLPSQTFQAPQPPQTFQQPPQMPQAPQLQQFGQTQTAQPLSRRARARQNQLAQTSQIPQLQQYGPSQFPQADQPQLQTQRSLTTPQSQISNIPPQQWSNPTQHLQQSIPPAQQYPPVQPAPQTQYYQAPQGGPPIQQAPAPQQWQQQPQQRPRRNRRSRNRGQLAQSQYISGPPAPLFPVPQQRNQPRPQRPANFGQPQEPLTGSNVQSFTQQPRPQKLATYGLGRDQAPPGFGSQGFGSQQFPPQSLFTQSAQQIGRPSSVDTTRKWQVNPNLTLGNLNQGYPQSKRAPGPFPARTASGSGPPTRKVLKKGGFDSSEPFEQHMRLAKTWPQRIERFGQPSRLESAVRYRIAYATYDHAIGVLEKPSLELEKIAPLWIGFSNRDLQYSDIVEVSEVQALKDFKSPVLRAMDPPTLSTNYTTYFRTFHILVPAHVATNFRVIVTVPTPRNILNNQLVILANKLRARSFRDQDEIFYRVHVRVVAIQCFKAEKEVTHPFISDQFVDYSKLVEGTNVLGDFFMIPKRTYLKVGNCIVRNSPAWTPHHFDWAEPSLLVRALKPITPDFEEIYRDLGKFDRQFDGIDEYKRLEDYQKSGQGTVIAYEMDLKRRAVDLARVELKFDTKMKGDIDSYPFLEDHETVFKTKYPILALNVKPSPYLTKACAQEFDITSEVELRAKNWVDPRGDLTSEKANTMTAEEIADHDRKREERLDKFILIGTFNIVRIEPSNEEDESRPGYYFLRRIIRVPVLSAKERAAALTKEREEAKLLYEEETLEEFKSRQEQPDEDRIKTLPEYQDRIRHKMDEFALMIDARSTEEADKIAEVRQLEQMKPWDKPGISDEQYFSELNLRAPGVELQMCVSTRDTGFENLITKVTNWETFFGWKHPISSILKMLLGIDPGHYDDEIAAYVKWRRQYKSIKRKLRCIQVHPNATGLELVILKLKKAIHEYVMSAEPRKRAKCQAEISGGLTLEIDALITFDPSQIILGEPVKRLSKKPYLEEIEIDEWNPPIDDILDRSDSSCGEDEEDSNELMKWVFNDPEIMNKYPNKCLVFDGRAHRLVDRYTKADAIEEITNDRYLDEGQRQTLLEGIEHGKPLSYVQAGAGTGKTRSLSRYTYYILKLCIKGLILLTATTNGAVGNFITEIANMCESENLEYPQGAVLLIRSTAAQLKADLEEMRDVDVKKYMLEYHVQLLLTYPESQTDSGLNASCFERLRAWLRVKSWDTKFVSDDEWVVDTVVKFSPNLRIVGATLEKARTVSRLSMATYMFMDEGGQIPAHDAIVSLTRSRVKTVVAFGDINQLLPYVPFQMVGKHFGFREMSIIDLLAKRMQVFKDKGLTQWQSIVTLVKAYRSYPVILNWLSASLYDRQLTSGISVRDRVMMENINWPLPKQDTPVFVGHVKGTSNESPTMSLYNRWQECAALMLYEQLARFEDDVDESYTHVFNGNYGATVGRLTRILAKRCASRDPLDKPHWFQKIRAATNNRFQGRQADVSILITTKSQRDKKVRPGEEDLNPDADFCLNPNRTTTGMTRARELLVAVGDVNFLYAARGTRWNKLLDEAISYGVPIIDLVSYTKFVAEKGPDYVFTYAGGYLVDDQGRTFLADLPINQRIARRDMIKLQPVTEPDYVPENEFPENVRRGEDDDGSFESAEDEAEQIENVSAIVLDESEEEME